MVYHGVNSRPQWTSTYQLFYTHLHVNNLPVPCAFLERACLKHDFSGRPNRPEFFHLP